ncbi:MAG: hypothetical protein HY332_14390 [Chloroflexi bacterium]|nr:hypothetical protein [Chloroflexota bacterium]
MPDFARAEITTTTEDLTSYKNFLRKLEIGQVVTLPLEEGETTRKVMRALNAAAQECEMRISRLPSDERSVRFKVVPQQKRSVNISPEARQARIEKARATRAAKKAAAA